MRKRFGRKRTGRVQSVWKRFERLRTERDEGRAYYGGNALRLGIGALTLLTLISLTGWLLRRRARETVPAAPATEEGAERLPSPFKNLEGEAEYMAAHEARMQRWPVPYEAMDITGRYGRTQLVASGPEDAPPLVLLHGALASLTMWAPNIADLSRDYRVYAIDIIGEPSKSIPDPGKPGKIASRG